LVIRKPLNKEITLGENMNIEKVFNAVSKDEMNPPLPSILWELEKQGYSVKLEGVDVTADDIDSDLFADLEKATNEFTFELFKGNVKDQKFKLVFSDYHQFSFKQVA
jgi:hypothetical protein